MLDKDNIISTSVSEAVEKIPTDENDYRKCSFMFYFAQPQHTKSRPTHRKSCLPTRMNPVQLKKKEDIVNKTYTEKGTITGI